MRTLSKLLLLRQTFFGLPWTITGALLPFADPSFAWQRRWDLGLWILLAFTAARSAGMAFNRLIDRNIDAENPRTQDRALPNGEVRPIQVCFLACMSSAVFMIAAFQINLACFAVSPLVLFLLWAYSYTKRFTSLCHFVLGVIQFFGPVGAWLAVTGEFSVAPILLGGAVLVSISSNDIVYAVQDIEFDRKRGLRSVPASLGVKKGLQVAKLLHLVAVLLLLQLGIFLHLNFVYYLGVGVVAFIYLTHHFKMNPNDHQSLHVAFTSCNTWVGLTFMVFTIGSLLWPVLS